MIYLGNVWLKMIDGTKEASLKCNDAIIAKSKIEIFSTITVISFVSASERVSWMNMAEYAGIFIYYGN